MKNKRAGSAGWERLLAATLVVGFFVCFASGGLLADFSADDLMNLHQAWIRGVPALLFDNVLFFLPAYRPFGGLFYTAVYESFGFNPRPFRIICFAVLAGNLALLFDSARRLSGSQQAALLSGLAGAFHTSCLGLYYNTGTCYDLFSFLFYFAALDLYIAWPDQRSRKRIAAIVVLYMAALNSKEAALSLPAVLLLYEWFYSPPLRRTAGEIVRWLAFRGRTAIATAAIGAAFITGRVLANRQFMAHEGYRPRLSPGAWLESLAGYANELVYQVNWVNQTSAALGLGALFVIAYVTGRREVKFCVWMVAVALIPVTVIPPRGLYAAYIPLGGLAMFAGSLFVVTPRGIPARAWLWAIILAGGALLARAHVHAGAFDVDWILGEQRAIRSVGGQMVRLYPKLPGGSRILFLNEPFGRPTSHDLVFLARLIYRDKTLTVDQYHLMEPKPGPEKIAGYEHVFRFDEGKLVELPSGGRT